MRFYDGLLTFPNILLAIALVAALGPSLLNIAIALGVSQAPLDARLTRSIVLSLRERDYVLVQFSLAMGFAVLAEGSLSFLGLGTQPPTPSWGGMLNDSRPYMREAPWYGIWPGLAMAILLIALNFLTDAARDVMDPRRINIAR
jgi:ABC-type dipeptide/oligopeptide/nickel transport system permease subunit